MLETRRRLRFSTRTPGHAARPAHISPTHRRDQPTRSPRRNTNPPPGTLPPAHLTSNTPYQPEDGLTRAASAKQQLHADHFPSPRAAFEKCAGFARARFREAPIESERKRSFRSAQPPSAISFSGWATGAIARSVGSFLRLSTRIPCTNTSAPPSQPPSVRQANPISVRT
jgi:hypothetical protein